MLFMPNEIEQNLRLTGSRFLKQRDYWLDKLSGAYLNPAVLFEPGIKQGRGNAGGLDKIEIRLPGELCTRLIKLSKDSNLSLYIILAAGLKILIHRYTGCEDILVASPVNMLKASEETMNHILLIRDFIAGDMTFKALLLEIRESVLGAYENQDYPFDKLLQHLEHVFPRRCIMNNDYISLSLKNLHEEKNSRAVGGKISFAFEKDQKDQEVISGHILYDPGVCARDYIEQMAGHFTRILEQATADITVTPVDIILLSETEKQQLLFDFNDTSSGRDDYPADMTLHRLCEEQGERSPDHIAVFGHSIRTGRLRPTNLSYRQLHDQAGRLAQILTEKGVLPDNIAGIMMERSIEMIVGILGILKAGGAYLPIEPEYPQERIDYMLKDSKAKIIIDPEFLMNAPQASLHHSSAISHHSSQLAYIIYTSGTTGKPKGVMVEHRGAVNTITWRKQEYKLDSNDKVLQLFSFAFDGFVTSFFTPIVSGSQVIIVPAGDARDAAAVKSVVISRQITHFICVPAFYSLLLEAFTPGESCPLRIVTLAGQELKTQAIEKNSQFRRPPEIVNEYGATENSVAATCCRDANKIPHIHIGRPIANTKVHILDKWHNLLPVGAVGEIGVSGKGTARGYLNQVDLTSGKFAASPFAKGERIYLTGDIGRRLPDPAVQGTYIIEFLGRIDHQVKIRGFRIELGEIEHFLSLYPAVKRAVVVDKEIAPGSRSLCAYVVWKEAFENGKIPDSAGLKEYLAKKLPDYMLPSFFVFLDEFPLTPSGKIDRQALPQPEPASGVEYIAPRNETEKKLAEIWGQVLEIEAGKIGIDNNFFELGGHSLTATILAARLYKEYRADLPVGVIFEFPRLKDLARYLENAVKKTFNPINPGEKKDYYPLSPSQKGIYVVQMMAAAGIGFNMATAVVLSGNLDRRKLENTFRMLIARHESLRTSFQIQCNEAVQRIHDQVAFELDFQDFDRDLHDSHDSHDYHHMIKQFIRPFHLARAPLLRVKLLAMEKDKHLLLVDMHHIITDGISLRILIKDFMAFYSGEELPPIRLQYRDFSQWQNNLVKSGEMEKQEAYWLHTLKGPLTLLDIPTDFPRPAARGFEGNAVTFEISGAEKSKLDELARTGEVTMYMALLAIYNILLTKLSGSDDITVGTVFAGRQHIDLQEIIGLFINMVVMRNFPAREKTFRDFLSEVKNNALDASQNQDYPFNLLVEKLVKERTPGRNPLVDIGFGFHDGEPSAMAGHVPRLKKTGLTIEPYDFAEKKSELDFTFHGLNAGDRVSFVVEYRVGLFKKETIVSFTRYFNRILNAVLQDPDIKIKEIEIMPQAEKEKALAGIRQKKNSHPIEFDI